MSWSQRRTGGERGSVKGEVVEGASCRRGEKEKVKISHGIDRDNSKEMRERERRCVFGEVLVPFWRGYGCFSFTAKLQRLFIKAVPGDGSPPSPPSSSSSSFFSSLCVSLSFFPASTQPFKTAGREASEREEERGVDKRTQREKD